MRPGQFTHAPCDKRITELESELAALRAIYDEFVKNGETETVKRLKSALRAAVELIRMWHGSTFYGNGPLAETAWQAYQESEEMREITEALK